jgi:hypothetical protein
MTPLGVTLVIVGFVVLLWLAYLAKEVWDAVKLRRQEEKEYEERYLRDEWDKGL